MLKKFLEYNEIKNLFVYDFETNGFINSKNFDVLELAYERFELMDEGVLFKCKGSSLFDTLKPLDENASKVTGISKQMLKGRPTFDKALGSLKEMLDKPATVVCGFNNTSFDDKILQKEFSKKYGEYSPISRSIDCYSIYKKLTGRKKGTLSEVAAYLGVSASNSFHRAAFDVDITSKVLEAMIIKYGVVAVSEVCFD